VVKPAAETPLTAMAITGLLAEAGVPAGVVNLLPTTDAPGVVSTWLQDPRVRKISFTGSTPVGRVLLRQAADRVVNSSMELGGNAPFVVTEDADLDAAVEGALAALRVGPATDPRAQVGPVISPAAATRIEQAIEDAVAAGARAAHRATLPDGLTGYFVAPTVLAGVPADAAIVRDEIFGPVAPVVTFATDEEVVRLANDSEYGLAAYVYAGNLQRALRLGEAFDAGMVGVNRGVVSDPSAPFGGVKQSGLGREGAREGLLEYTEQQYLSIDWSEPL
jgi:succinate-semialdehyde dehydrogenase / glutarate-semialdehyde dehydrogenase